MPGKTSLREFANAPKLITSLGGGAVKCTGTPKCEKLRVSENSIPIAAFVARGR